MEDIEDDIRNSKENQSEAEQQTPNDIALLTQHI